MTERQAVQKFVSKRNETRVLHALVDPSSADNGRIGISPAADLLQVSVIILADGASIGPHRHNPTKPAPASTEAITQEAWIVLRGSLRLRLFDEDNELIATTKIGVGQILVTFRGGHAFDSAEQGTIIVECKNGPYLGRDYTLLEAQGS